MYPKITHNGFGELANFEPNFELAKRVYLMHMDMTHN